jgi:hypothetical protein
MPSILLLLFIIFLGTGAAAFVYGMHFERKATIRRYGDFGHPAEAARLQQKARILRIAGWVAMFLALVMLVLLIT